MSRYDIADDIRFPDGPEEPEDDDRRLRWCRRGQHSLFGPICMTCGHDMMKRMNGEACVCEVCRTLPSLPGPVDPPRPPGWDKGVA